MSYGDGHAQQTAKDIAEILRKSQIAAKAREESRSKRDYNAGLHAAAMLIHARASVVHDDEVKVLLEEIEKAIQLAKVKE